MIGRNPARKAPSLETYVKLYTACRRSWVATPVVCAMLLLGAATARAQVRLDAYVSGLSLPIGFVQDPSNPSVQYVVEQGGSIRVIQNGALLPTPFLNLASLISCCGERGLLGV